MSEKEKTDGEMNSVINVKAVLLDMDGVLVKSREAWFRAFNESAGVDRRTFNSKYWGRDLNKNLAEIGADRAHFCEEIFPKHALGVEMMEGVDEALRHLCEIGVILAVITNTTENCTRQILSRFGLDSYFEEVVTSDAVSRGKPDPEMVLHACSAVGVEPHEAVVVGDSAEDMIAGKRAGCYTVGLKVDGDRHIKNLGELPEMITATPKDSR